MAGIVEHKEFDVLQQGIDKLVGEVAREVFTRIYNRTPVDTGYAQSRWKMFINDADFTIDNDCEYISYLENGHSQQAPLGMVAITMNEVDSIIADVARRTIK